jgi:hypothetical protein
MHSFNGGLSGTDYAKTDVEHRHINEFSVYKKIENFFS